MTTAEDLEQQGAQPPAAPPPPDAGADETPPPDDPTPPDPGDPPADDDDDDAAGDELGDEQRRQLAQARAAESEVDIERALKQLANEANRHANRVEQIMGPDFQQLEVCPLCTPAMPGFRFPVYPDEETRERVKVAIGMADVHEFRDATDAQMCVTCDGEGRVRSGSKVNEQMLLKCLSCDGRGWTSASPQRTGIGAAPAPPPDQPHAVVDEHTPPPPAPDLDPWQTPRDDPEWGMLPNLRSAEGQARVQARLANVV